MREKIIIAGAGGHGIMLLGKILAQGALREGREVTWLPAYGAEVRGGSAYCMVIISDRKIGSPYVEKADTLIAMNGLSLSRFKPRLKENGLLLFNSSLVTGKVSAKARIMGLPFTGTALKLGNVKVANVVALGAFIAGKKVLDKKNILRVIKDMAPQGKKDLIEINRKALCAGIGLINDKS